MKRRHRPAINAAVLAISLGLFSVRLFHDAPNMEVVTAAVTTGPVPRQIVATGTVRATATTTVGTTLTGSIQSVEARENSAVRAGQVLARLDPEPYRTALVSAQEALAQVDSDLRTDQAALEDFEWQRSRAEELAADRSITQGEIDGADLEITRLRDAVSADENRVSDARAAVDVSTMNLQFTVIRSPVDGIVVPMEPRADTAVDGAGASPGLFRIATDLSYMEVEADVGATETAALHAGDRATITCEGQMLNGTVRDIRDRAIDSAGTRASALVEVPNRGALLRPGMTVMVAFNDSRLTTVVRIPNRALAFKPDPDLLDAIREVRVPFFPVLRSGGAPLSDVWEYNGTEFTAVGVRTGSTDGEWTEIVAGALQPGDRLVTSASLTPGNH